jgi:hypothetical protein
LNHQQFFYFFVIKYIFKSQSATNIIKRFLNSFTKISGHCKKNFS